MMENFCQVCHKKLRCYDPGITSYWICDNCQTLYVLRKVEEKYYDVERKKYVKREREILEKDLKGGKNNG